MRSREAAGSRRARPSAPLRELGASVGASLLIAGSTFAAAAASLLPAGFLSAACWLLVGAGITGTFLAGRGIAWGWLLLVGLQPLWISYAIATGQYGFIFGALAYGGAQMSGFLRSRGR